MLALSPFALRLLKASFNADEDGLAGIQQLAHDANLLFYMSEEAPEGRSAYLEKRRPTSRSSPGGRDDAEPTRPRQPERDPHLADGRAAADAAGRVAPVLVGTALAGFAHVFHPLRFLAALIGAIFIQVGTNLSNDYSDARRGADTEDRLGPVRVTAGGLVPPRQVLIATYVSFGVAVLAGIYLIVVAGWQLLLVGAASILAGVLYTGGPRPYGYEGLGEVFVFLFFGIVAVAGSFFVQVEHLRLGGVRARGAGRPARLGDPRRQQRPRHRHRPPRRQAHARGAARPRRARASCTRRWSTARTCSSPVTWVFGPLKPWVLLAVADAAGRRPGRPRRAQPHRRAVAQRRTGPDRDAAAGVLRAALRGPAAQPVRVGIHPVNARLRAPFVSAQGAVDARAAAAARDLRAPTGSSASARPSPLGIRRRRIDDVRARSRTAATVLGDSDGGPIASVLAACANLAVLPQAVAAIDLALLGPRRPPGRAAGLATARRVGAAPDPVEVNATIAAADRAGAAARGRRGPRRRAFAASRSRSDSATTPAGVAAVRAAGGPDMAIRLDANGAWTVPEAIALAARARPRGTRAVRGAGRADSRRSRRSRPRATCRSPSTRAARCPARSTTARARPSA